MSSARCGAVVVVGLSFLVAIVPEVAAQTPQPSAQDPPIRSGPPPTLGCSFSGPFLHIPSRGAGTEGLLVRVSPPVNGRYPNGAPIAVHMNASRPSVSGSRACLSEQGFIDVGFLCPGGQYRGPDGTLWKSGGADPADQVHAQNCVEPLADVLSFATGKTRSLEGKSIQDYVEGVRAMTDNAGVIGWSFGGNLAVLAMARHGRAKS